MDALNDLQADVRLSISNPQAESSSVYGRGIAALCRGIRERGSLYAAAKNMGMAYSKAWRIIKSTEEALGVLLLVRDGAHGSHLTEEGERLLDIYASLEKELSEKAVELYQQLNEDAS